MSQTIFVILLILLAGFSAYKLILYIRDWKLDVERVRKGGYCPPVPDLLGVVIIRMFSILFGFLEVGPIRVFGKNRIPKEGIVVLLPLHVDPGDVAFVSEALGAVPFWYMIRTTEMVSWRGWMGARTGALAICEETDEGRSAGFKASLEAITRKNGPRFVVVFAQGELVQSERIIRSGFKEGFYGLARLGSRKLKQPVFIQPMALHYKRDPRLQTLFQRIMRAFGFEHFRNLFGYRNYGGVAVIGHPFLVDASGQSPASHPRLLPKDAEKVLDTCVQNLRILQRAALKLSNESPETIAAITGGAGTADARSLSEKGII